MWVLSKYFSPLYNLEKNRVLLVLIHRGFTLSTFQLSTYTFWICFQIFAKRNHNLWNLSSINNFQHDPGPTFPPNFANLYIACRYVLNILQVAIPFSITYAIYFWVIKVYKQCAKCILTHKVNGYKDQIEKIVLQY